ncbi:MAG: hypothetical protein WD971_07555 [Pirellulales bacterium]
MGIDATLAAVLLSARVAGVDFSETATLGKQIFFPTCKSMDAIARAFALPGGAAAVFERCGSTGDRFLELVGAKSVTSFDVSDFEGATVIHDMNEPVSPEFHGKFTAVLDGGTLEHIFNVRQAFKNALEMVRLGGHYLCVTCGNNLFGHGFYQISSDFFYQSLTPENGFAETAVLLCLPTLEPPWFYAIAPSTLLGKRVELVNDRPAYLMAIARRISLEPVFACHPQQSDYQAAWQRAAGGAAEQPVTLPRGFAEWATERFLKLFPRSNRAAIKRTIARDKVRMDFRQSCYQRLTLHDLAQGKMAHPAIELTSSPACQARIR